MDEMQPQQAGEADRLWSSGHGSDSASSDCFFASSVRDAPSGGLSSGEEHIMFVCQSEYSGQGGATIICVHYNTSTSNAIVEEWMTGDWTLDGSVVDGGENEDGSGSQFGCATDCARVFLW